MPDYHCRACTDTAACGGYHVYVIELGDGAELYKPWRDRDVADPARDNGTCLYVGMTAHRPSCRLGQHRNFAEDLATFPCGCFTGGTVVDRPFRHETTGRRTGGNRVVGAHARKLRPQFFWKFNPLATQKAALKKEAELAAELRELGYRVHQA
jgi:hypothetical protein